MESRTADWDESEENSLDAASLAVVERGMAGMRSMNPREQQLLEASRRKHARARRLSRILKSSAVAAIVLVAASALVATGAAFRAYDQQELAALQYKSATVHNWIPLKPLDGLLEAIAITGDSLRSRKSVLPSVQFALFSSLVEATETTRVEKGYMAGIAISPDGLSLATSRILAGRPEHVVEFWDRQLAPTGSLPQPLRWGSAEKLALAFSPDGHLVAMGGLGVNVWDRRRKKLSDRFGGASIPATDMVLSVAFTPDGKYPLSGHSDGMLRVWTPDGQPVAQVQADQGLEPLNTLFPRQPVKGVIEPGGAVRRAAGSVNAIATSRGIRGEILAATGGDDGFARLWRLDEGRPVPIMRALYDFRRPIRSLAMTIRRGEVLVASGAMNGSVQVWDQPGKATEPYYFLHPVVAVAFNPKTDVVAAAARNEIRFLDLSGAEIAPPFRGFQEVVTALAFFPDGERLAAAGAGSTRVIDVTRPAGARTVTALQPFQTAENRIIGAAFLKGGSLVAGTESGDLLFWYPETDSVRRVEHAHGGPLERLTTNRQGSLIAGGGSDGRIRLFDARGNNLGDLTPPAGEDWKFSPIFLRSDFVFSPDGKVLASLHLNGEVLLWDVNTKRQLATIHGPGQEVGQRVVIAFTAASDQLVTTYDNKLRFWRLDGSPAASSSTDLKEQVAALALRPDGQGLVTGDWYGILRRWNMQGKEIRPLVQCCTGMLAWIAVDGESERIFLVTGGGQSGVGVISYPAQGAEIYPEPLASYDVRYMFRSAALSLEEDAIVTVDSLGVRVWPASWRAALKVGCERLHDHSVFQNHQYAAGLKTDAIERAHKVCVAELWKK